MSEAIMGLLNPAITAIFAVIFVTLWLRARSAVHVLAVAVAYFCLTIGFLIFHFIPNPNGVAETLAMHTVYSIGTLAMCWGLARRVGQRIPMAIFLAIPIVVSLVIVAGSFGTNMNARLVAINTGYGLMMALTTHSLTRQGAGNIFDRMVTWLFGISAAQFFIRPLLAMIMSGPMSAENYRDSESYALWMLTMGVVTLLLALSVVAAVVYDLFQAERTSAERDHLTGLKMRRAFEDDVMRLLDENGDRRTAMSMIVADIDHFKAVNDTFGHQAGDAAIAGFGKLIGDTVRDTDICGRVGGEEFCILVWNCDLGPALRLAERLRRAFSEAEYEALGEGVRLTASFGVVQWREGEGYGKLFARADKALYEAKDAGRNRVATERQAASVAEIGSNIVFAPRKTVGNAA